MRVLTPRLGDLFAIQLTGGKVAYAHYVFQHPQYGSMVEVKSIVDHGESSVAEVLAGPKLFPPVFVGLRVPVRKRLWRKCGESPVTVFEFPTFRSTNGLLHNDEPGTYNDWSLWAGDQFHFIGELPVEYRSLEFLVVWGSDVLEERIESGINYYDKML